MIGVTGMLGVELLGFGNWYDTPLATKQTYFGLEISIELNTLIVIELTLMGVVEAIRFGEIDSNKKLYPGFDFAGVAKDPKKLESLKLKEIKNGRLAMISFLGFIAQHVATGKSPLVNLGDHLADPFHCNVSSNGMSIP